MMIDLVAMQTMATQVLNTPGIGQTVQVSFVDADTYNPGSSSVEHNITTVSGKAAIVAASSGYDGQTYGGTLIAKGDAIMYLAASDSFPRFPKAESDYVTDSLGQKWKIKAVNSNNPSGALAVCHFCLVGK